VLGTASITEFIAFSLMSDRVRRAGGNIGRRSWCNLGNNGFASLSQNLM